MARHVIVAICRTYIFNYVIFYSWAYRLFDYCGQNWYKPLRNRISTGSSCFCSYALADKLHAPNNLPAAFRQTLHEYIPTSCPKRWMLTTSCCQPHTNSHTHVTKIDCVNHEIVCNTRNIHKTAPTVTLCAPSSRRETNDLHSAREIVHMGNTHHRPVATVPLAVQPNVWVQRENVSMFFKLVCKARARAFSGIIKTVHARQTTHCRNDREIWIRQSDIPHAYGDMDAEKRDLHCATERVSER